MFTQLYRYLGTYKKYLLVCFSLVLLEVVGEMTIPLLMARIVDAGIPRGDMRLIIATGIVMVVIALACIALGVLNMWFSAKASQGFAANIRKALFERILTYSFVTIDQFSTASLVTRLTNDVTQLQNTVMMMLRILLRAPLMLICAMIFAVSMNARLSVIIFVSVPLLILCILLIIKKAEKLFGLMQQRLDDMNTRLQENLIGIRVVKAFVREQFETKKFDQVNRSLLSSATDAGNLVSVIMPLMFLILNGATVAVIWFGGHMVGNHLIGTGSLVSFISYLMQILISIMIFSMIFMLIARAEASARRIIEVLQTHSDIANPITPVSKHITKGRIEFDHVHFRYPTDKDGCDVLSDISMMIEPGRVIGIVGGTGSGKTTLLHLIPRLFDTTQGRVIIDGIPVTQYRLDTLRRQIGMVLQKNVLFSGTIRDNLLWGNELATLTDIEKACKLAAADTFIHEFSLGYDTVLGQGGVNLSGGQKQRICIARALLKQPKILLLDDSTSAVDTATETVIQKTFRQELSDSTVLLVAQRISSVKEADAIMVIDDGKLVAFGNHETLKKTSPIYQEICLSQQEGLGG